MIGDSAIFSLKKGEGGHGGTIASVDSVDTTDLRCSSTLSTKSGLAYIPSL